jgi:hypothetical protein
MKSRPVIELFFETNPMVIARLDGKAEKSEMEEKQIDAKNKYWYSGDLCSPGFSPVFRFSRISHAFSCPPTGSL